MQGGSVNRKLVVAKDLLLQIQCLNLIRKVVDDSIILGDYITEIKAAGTKGLDVLFWVIFAIFLSHSRWNNFPKFLNIVIITR